MAVYDTRGTTPVHMDRILTNISVAYPNGPFLGSVFFPSVNVRKQSDRYYIFGREAWGVVPGNDLRAPGAEANEIAGISVSTDTYFAVEHALQIAVTDEERENADSPLQPLTDGTELVTAQLLLARELAIKTLLTTAANYATGLSVTLSGTAQWNDYVNSNPIDDVRAARTAIYKQIFMEPTDMAIPYEVMAVLENHPDFIERIKYSERGILTPELISNFFGGMRIHTAGAAYNSANPGQTAALGFIWGKDVFMAWVPPRAGLKTPAFGYEFVWGYGGGTPMVTERWREDRRVSDVVRVRRRYDLKFVSQDVNGKAIAGYIIKNAIA
jgi:hypothetical protein